MEQQERQEKRLRAALRMAEVLRREARHFADLPPGLRPDKLTGAGKQFNEFVNWMQQELGIRLPFSPLPDDPDPTTLSLAATQLVGALQVLIGEEVVEEPKERKREPVLRIREQKSPVEFSELVITSAEELAELLRTGLPEWIKSVVTKAADIAEKAVSKATEVEVEKTLQTVQIECEEEGKETEVEDVEQLEELGEHIEELTEELAEVEEELAEAAEEGYLTEELKAQLEAKKARIKQKLKETLRTLQHALGE
jgi:vacuolar-type H+-ATPase subunit I/STV1